LFPKYLFKLTAAIAAQQLQRW